MSLSADVACPDEGLDAQIRRALRGDAQAYASVVLATQRGITGLALAIVRDVVLASLADPQPDAEQRLSRDQEWSAVVEAIDALPEGARETLLVYYREGENSAVAGRLLGMRPEAVRQRVSRARRSLQSRVLVALDEGLSASAPDAGFTAAVVTAIGGGAIGAALPSTAMAGVGAAGWWGAGKYATGQGAWIALGQSVAGVCAAIAVGTCGALLGIRLRGRDAVRRDDPSIRIAVEVYAIAATLAFAAGIAAGARIGEIRWWYLPLLFVIALAMGAFMARVVPPMIRRLNRVGWVERLNARLPPVPPARLRLVALCCATLGAIISLLLIGWLER